MATMTFLGNDVQSNPPVSTKPRAFYAHLYDQSGMLAKINGTIYFIADDTKQITRFEIPMVNFCTVLGEVITSEAQAMWDRVAGGAPAIACTRQEGTR